jgi:hypothetical protein
MDFQSLINTSPNITGAAGAILAVFVIWSLLWKGLALWRAGRRNEPGWFIILLFLNTLGILEIIYYFLVAGSDKKK